MQAGLLCGLVFGAGGLAQLEMNRAGLWPGGWDDVVRRSLLGPLPAAVALSFADLRTRLGSLAAVTLWVFTLMSGVLYAHTDSSTAALAYLPQLFLFVPWAVGFTIWSRVHAPEDCVAEPTSA